ncbi:MAG TPA: beta-ketoacyl-ACP synthase II [Dehalococcoidia bacterium]
MATPNDSQRRVVITGMGIISPLGLTVDDFWQACVEGRSGVGLLTAEFGEGYPTRVVAEVKGFDPHDYIDRKDARRMARFSQMAVAAARQALEDAGLDLEREDRARCGVLIGNGIGGFPNVDEAMRVMLSRGGMRVDPFFVPKMLPNMAAANVSMVFGLKGYSNTVTTACAAGTQALGDAMNLIRHGRADVIVAGGTEAGISELGLAGFAVMRAMTTRNDDPQRASRPFDKDRDGFVSGEGAAMLVLESLEHALRRGARIRAELAGYGACSDAFHIVAPCADGEGAARAITWALEDAGVTPDEVDYINAHGTSTPLNDVAETLAIKRALGERAYQVPVSSTKSMVGHGLGASGAIESVACVRTLETGIIHPTINYETPDPECDLDYVPNRARRADVRVVLKNSFGFGGQNACLVFRRYEE